jgi:hypothetical protein
MGTTKRVEVKSATILPSGTQDCQRPKDKAHDKRVDILASVDNFSNIIYEPEIWRIILKFKAQKQKYDGYRLDLLNRRPKNHQLRLVRVLSGK